MIWADVHVNDEIVGRIEVVNESRAGDASVADYRVQMQFGKRVTRGTLRRFHRDRGAAALLMEALLVLNSKLERGGSTRRA